MIPFEHVLLSFSYYDVFLIAILDHGLLPFTSPTEYSPAECCLLMFMCFRECQFGLHFAIQKSLIQTHGLIEHLHSPSLDSSYRPEKSAPSKIAPKAIPYAKPTVCLPAQVIGPVLLLPLVLKPKGRPCSLKVTFCTTLALTHCPPATSRFLKSSGTLKNMYSSLLIPLKPEVSYGNLSPESVDDVLRRNMHCT